MRLRTKTGLRLENFGEIGIHFKVRRMLMQANIKIDESLLAEAMKISGIKTKAAVLNMALKEYLRKDNQKNILKFKSANTWEGNIEEMRSAR